MKWVFQISLKGFLHFFRNLGHLSIWEHVVFSTLASLLQYVCKQGIKESLGADGPSEPHSHITIHFILFFSLDTIQHLGKTNKSITNSAVPQLLKWVTICKYSLEYKWNFEYRNLNGKWTARVKLNYLWTQLKIHRDSITSAAVQFSSAPWIPCHCSSPWGGLSLTGTQQYQLLTMASLNHNTRNSKSHSRVYLVHQFMIYRG